MQKKDQKGPFPWPSGGSQRAYGIKSFIASLNERKKPNEQHCRSNGSSDDNSCFECVCVLKLPMALDHHPLMRFLFVTVATATAMAILVVVVVVLDCN